MTEHREFSAADILDWNRAESPVIRVRIPRDTVPGVALPVWLGFDVVFGDLAVGLAAVWTPWWRVEDCHAEGTGEPACQRHTKGLEHYLFLGVGLRLHLEFVE